MTKPRFKVLTYNIRSLVRKRRQDRVFRKIRGALAELQPDILCLQEVFLERQALDFDQSILGEYFPHIAFGQNATFFRGHLGNAVLSRFPIQSWENYDLSIKGREPRGCLKTTIQLPGGADLHLLVVHLGLRHQERDEQFRFLSGYLNKMSHAAPLVVAGDFNDWRYALHSLAYKKVRLRDASEVQSGSLARTFPAVCPLFPLDRIYFGHIQLAKVEVLRKGWRTVSDHLPLIATFEL